MAWPRAFQSVNAQPTEKEIGEQFLIEILDGEATWFVQCAASGNASIYFPDPQNIVQASHADSASSHKLRCAENLRYKPITAHPNTHVL